MSSSNGTIIEYYDKISLNYDKLRQTNYHNYLNEKEFLVIKDMISNKIVLDAGCGTGIILEQVKCCAQLAIGVDISEKMVNLAKQKDLSVYNSSIDNLAFSDGYFDLVYSFKVLPHVNSFWPAINELSRVTKQNGNLVIELYNKISLRYIINNYISEDKVPYTRYDTSFLLIDKFKKDFFVEKVYGIRLLGMNSILYDFVLFQNFDSLLADSFLKWFAGFIILVLRKK